MDPKLLAKPKVWCFVIFGYVPPGNGIKIRIHRTDHPLTREEAMKVFAHLENDAKFLIYKAIASPDSDGEKDLARFLGFILSEKNLTEFATLLVDMGFTAARDLILGHSKTADQSDNTVYETRGVKDDSDTGKAKDCDSDSSNPGKTNKGGVN